MTPGARVAAAIEILDRIIAGTAAEKALTNWTRGSRFAGSGDRAAIRDHVYDAIRCWSSYAAMGGAETGRGLMIGALSGDLQRRAVIFSGEGYAPPPLSDAEVAACQQYEALDSLTALDCPVWLEAPLRDSLGSDFEVVLSALRHRAPIFLRVNTARTARPVAAEGLAQDGIQTKPHPLSANALEVIGNERKIRQSAAYLRGDVELQDAASQAVVEYLPLKPGMRVLDYCSGGGGKALAMAAVASVQVTAHDIDAARMQDLGRRSDRAGVVIREAATAALPKIGPFDLVLCDVPCSGSGAWRRSPEGKCVLSQARLDALIATQADILADAAQLVADSGYLAYSTCSLLSSENQAQIDAFTRRFSEWHIATTQQLTPLDGGDGFFVAILTR